MLYVPTICQIKGIENETDAAYISALDGFNYGVWSICKGF